MDWFAGMHRTWAHIPLAISLLLPPALFLALPSGKDSEGWRWVSKYLAWCSLLLGFLAMGSGLLHALGAGHMSWAHLWSPSGVHSLGFHLFSGLLGLLCALLTLRALIRRRKSYEGLPTSVAITGMIWCLSWGCTAWLSPRAPSPTQALPVPPRPSADPAPKAVLPDPPTKYLDFSRLEPLRMEPLFSPSHGNRWIQIWASPNGVEAYRNRQALPKGSYVVLSTREHRAGRISAEPGPLLALETMDDGQPKLTVYWPRVPEDRRVEVNGEASVHWTSPDSRLKGCMNCHAQGLAQRPEHVVPRPGWIPSPKPGTETNP